MLQNYYNLFAFWGNAKVEAQVVEWKLKIDELIHSGKISNDANSMLSILLSDGRKTKVKEGLLGFENDVIDTGRNEIGVLSVGRRPELFEEALACRLYGLDKNVVVRNSFHNLVGRYGVAYTAPYCLTSAYSQSVIVDCDYDEFQSPEEAEADAEEKLKELENEIIEFFVDDMPKTKVRFKKNIAKGRIVWDSI